MPDIITGRAIETTAHFYARLAGLFHLLKAFTATLGGHILFPGFVLASSDVMASNFLKNEPLFWWGFANAVIGIVFHMPGFFFSITCSSP